MNRLSSHSLVCLVLLAVTFTSFGCSARRVVKGADYGVIAIPVDTNAWPFRYRDKAHELMSAHFPEGYVIEHEQETVVGQSIHTETDGSGATIQAIGPIELTAGTTESTTTTSDNTEWRIHYRRK